MSRSPPADAGDIQGLLWSGFASLPEAAFLLLRIADRDAARRALRALPITTIAQLETPQQTALQLALSAPGLRRLGVPPSVVEGFSAEFLAGMAGDESRSRRLGDVGANAPANWRWGGAGEPDLLLLLYAAAGALAPWKRRLIGELDHSGIAVIEELATSDMDGKEPFGFADGVSQPRIAWAATRRPGDPADLDYGNLISLGEFALGYRNEYGLYTERPLLPDAATDGLPAAEDQPGLGDLGRNGSYLVLRELHQDVRGFWRFVASRAGEGGAEALAEAMVGRRRSGDPLVPVGPAPVRGLRLDAQDVLRNGFTYDADPDGLLCPLGAHVRRANPRTGDLPGGRQGVLAQLARTLGLGRPDLRADLVASSRFHRLLRRGREFGAWMSPEEAMRADAPDPRSGLHFICLIANISRQFEFVQNAWLASARFAGLSNESDPLTGNRIPFPTSCPTDGFRLPQPNGAARRLISVPQFATVRGGGYFFMPGMRALRYLTQSRERDNE